MKEEKVRMRELEYEEISEFLFKKEEKKKEKKRKELRRLEKHGKIIGQR